MGGAESHGATHTKTQPKGLKWTRLHAMEDVNKGADKDGAILDLFIQFHMLGPLIWATIRAIWA